KLSDGDHSEVRVKAFQIKWVACDDGISSGLGADHDVSIDNVRSSGTCEKSADSLCVRSVQGDKIDPIQMNHSPKPHLFCRISDSWGGGVARDVRWGFFFRAKFGVPEGPAGHFVPARSDRRHRKRFHSRGAPTPGPTLPRREHLSCPRALLWRNRTARLF